MNFNAVDQADGKNVTIWATMDTWDSIAFTPNQAKYLSCKLIDDDGVGHSCRIYEGKGTLPEKDNEKQRLEFFLSCYHGTTSKGQPYTGYSGFWSHGAVQSPQSSPQSPQNAPESINTPQQGSWEIVLRTRVVCAYLASGTKPLVEDIEYWMEYIKTGKDASLPGNKNESDGQEGICSHCQKPLEDCTCDIKF